MSNKNLSPRQLVILILVFFIFVPLCAVFYSGRGNPYGLAPSNDIRLLNPTKLENWLAPEAYDYTLEILQNYAANQDEVVDSMTIDGEVKPIDGAYSFKLTLLPSGQEHDISVLVSAFGSVVSTSVAVDGLTQTIDVNKQKGSTEFKNLDNLLDQGLSSAQANRLQEAFNKFDPSALTVTVDADNARLSLGEGGNPDTMTFNATVNNTTYSAKLSLWGISAIRLVLSDSSGQQVFDSGRLE